MGDGGHGASTDFVLDRLAGHKIMPSLSLTTDDTYMENTRV